MKIYGRHSWTPTSAGGEIQKVRNGILFVHYTVSSDGGANSLKKQGKVLRQIRHFHVSGRGYDDVGYNYLIMQRRFPLLRARVFEGRGRNRVPAAQYKHNTGNLSVAVVAGPKDRIRKSTVKALQDLYLYLGECNRLFGHRDVNSTDCPGPRLYSKLGKVRRVK